MYWLPVVFIIIEMIYFTSLTSLNRFNAYEQLKKRNKKKNFLTEEEIKKLPDYNKNKLFIVGLIVFLIYLITSWIYYIVGLFQPWWYLAAGYLFISLVSTAYGKMFPSKHDYDCFIDIDEIDNIQLQRKLKLENINGSTRKERIKILAKGYFFSFIRISVPVAIIVMHYHFNMF